MSSESGPHFLRTFFRMGGRNLQAGSFLISIFCPASPVFVFRPLDRSDDLFPFRISVPRYIPGFLFEFFSLVTSIRKYSSPPRRSACGYQMCTLRLLSFPKRAYFLPHLGGGFVACTGVPTFLYLSSRAVLGILNRYSPSFLRSLFERDSFCFPPGCECFFQFFPPGLSLPSARFGGIGFPAPNSTFHASFGRTFPLYIFCHHRPPPCIVSLHFVSHEQRALSCFGPGGVSPLNFGQTICTSFN